MLLGGLGFFVACTPSVDDNSGIRVDWQPIDSLNARLPEGVEVFEGNDHEWPLRAWYVRADVSRPDVSVRVAVSDDEDGRETASSFAHDTEACVVLNGGYFIMDASPARHVGLLQVDDSLYQPPTASVRRGEDRFRTARSAIGFTDDDSIDVAWVARRDDGLVEVLDPPGHSPGLPDTLDLTDARSWHYRDAVAAGPSLVSDGAVRVTVDEEVFFGTTIPDVHPRSAAGYTASGDLVLLVVDGRQMGSRGTDLHSLAEIMAELGCVEALNLDGGGSSTLVVDGVRLNRPVGGSIERGVMSALTVYCNPE
jgi:exopolysaccharide biosynthesis protein